MITHDPENPEYGTLFTQTLSPAHPMVIKAKAYLDFVETYDLSGLQPRSEKTQYEHRHKNMKKKGGRPPVDFNVAETVADLRTYFLTGDFKSFIRTYLVLQRFIPM